MPRGHTTATTYDWHTGQPVHITDPLGNTTRYKYDIYGRKTAEYGTALQPALYQYDEAGNLSALTTFRASAEEISTDPTGRTDGDTTRWEYAWQENAVLKKTYADGSAILTHYGPMNRVSGVTNARGQTITYTYDEPTGLLSGKDYSDGTPSIRYHYNHLGQYTHIEDASGEHLFEYDHYQRLSKTTSAYGIVEELYDDYGRSAGYTLEEEFALTPQIHYNEEGRISKLEIASGYEISYDYLPGTNLVNMLRYEPWAIEKAISYEDQRNLPVEMIYMTHASAEHPYPIIRTQINDELGRPVSRSQERGTDPVHYAYQYNSRSELVYATRNTDEYRYQYDNIGNRETAAEELMRTDYLTNPLNQYIHIESDEGDDFVPSYDEDGNQTLIKTNVGIWEVEYNAENRPVAFTLRQSSSRTTRMECLYDYMGRRFYKRYYHREGAVEETREDYFLYRGYLLVQRTGDNVEYLNAYVWDPSEPINTRLLYYVIPGPQIIFCGHDFNKNVTELFHYDIQAGVEESRTYYDYTPYGLMNGEGELSDSNPFCFSNEYLDQELGLVYYNYRHYNPADGRWIARDPIEEEGGYNLYAYLSNNSYTSFDLLGLNPIITFVRIAGTLAAHSISLKEGESRSEKSQFNSTELGTIQGRELIQSTALTGTPAGKSKNKTKCFRSKADYKSTAIKLTHFWGNILLLRLNINAQVTFSNGTVNLSLNTEGSESRQGNKKAGVRITAISALASAIEKECECFEKLPCITVTIHYSVLKDQPWGVGWILGGEKDYTHTIMACADGNIE